MATTRTPLRRNTRRRITPEAVEAFKAGDWAALHRALGLKPWELSPLDAGEVRPHPPGTGAYIHWPEARRLRKELEAAT